MLNYTNLFDELATLYREAGRDPESFRGLERALERADHELREYYVELTHDYCERLVQRLAKGDARVGAEERDLLRSWCTLDVPDPEQQEAGLLDALQELNRTFDALSELRSLPLNHRNLERLRRHILDCLRLLPSIRSALEERARVREVENLVEDIEGRDERARLLAMLRQRLLEETGGGS